MTATENTNTVERFVESVWNDRDYDVIDELFSEDYTGHWVMPGGQDFDRDGLREFIRGVHGGFSDLEMSIEFLHADDEYVTAGFTSHGTHDGEFMGIDPKLTASTTPDRGTPGHMTFRIEDGTVIEGWSTWDALGLMMALGVVPEDLSRAAPAADD